MRITVGFATGFKRPQHENRLWDTRRRAPPGRIRRIAHRASGTAPLARLLERWAARRASARAPYRAAGVHASLAGQSVADRCSSRSYALSLPPLRLGLRREDRARSDRAGPLGHTRSGLS